MMYSTSQPDSISGYLKNWDEVSFDDKRRVVNTLISKIEATSTLCSTTIMPLPYLCRHHFMDTGLRLFILVPKP